MRDRRKLAREVEELEQELSEVLRILHPHAIQILQLNQGDVMAITGITAGQTGTFQEVPNPSGSVFPLGTTFVWTSDDPGDTALTPSADGTHVAVAVAAAPALKEFMLTCTSSFTPTGAKGPLANSVKVPILGVVIPPTPTSLDINQL
jgi:hypothetical protein